MRLARMALGAIFLASTWQCLQTDGQTRDESTVLAHAEALLGPSGKAGKVTYRVDAALGHPEEFHLERTGDAVLVTAGGPAGVLYGIQEALAEHSVIGAEGRPDFDVRGAVLVLINAGWSYQSELTPEVFPWFFDRALMTRYLDYLASARLNTLVLWTGHLFPHIVELPEYPDATGLNPAQLHANQEQFRWLTSECAKRNITVLTHFYNIHISEHQAEALGRGGTEPTRYSKPDDFVRKYYYTILTRFFFEFPNVGLYICPGESLALEHQQDWFENVVFKAALDSGKRPKLVIRDWTLDRRFREALPRLYDNLYSELKHNDETITSPQPDVRHREWREVLRGHIVNLHDPADATPYRVGSPRLMLEMAGHWKRETSITGAWFYPPQAWCWPHTLDIVAGADDPNRALMTLDRDELWHLLEGRYLWKSDRDPAAEHAWAVEWLSRKFGNPEVGELLVEWYDLTGPVLPGLQNLTAVRFGNFFPTSVARVQADVDEILTSRSKLSDEPPPGANGFVGQRYYSRPIDAYTAELYRTRYDCESLADLHSMPVTQYAEALAANAVPSDAIVPDKLVDLYLEMARSAREKANQAAALGGNNPDELSRFVADSQALVYTVEYYRHKVLAALEKALLERTGAPKHADNFRRHLDQSVAKYEQLIAHVEPRYRAGSSMFAAKSWRDTLEDKVKWDREVQLRWLSERKERLARRVVKAKTAGRDVDDATMQQVYDEVKTPFKYGVVIPADENEAIDCPCVFRHQGKWYMLFVSIRDKIGYQTLLASSDDLLHWQRLGTVLPFAEKGWDAWQGDGGAALVDFRWGHSAELQSYDGKYWMTYIGGARQGYEPDPLAIGVAYTTAPGKPEPWTRFEGNPVLAPNDPDVREFEAKTLYKSNVIWDKSESLGYPFVMFYNGKQQGGGGHEAIGMAVSHDMTHWMRFGDTHIVYNGPESEYSISGDPQIVRIGDVWVMFYFGAFWEPGAFDTFACSYDLVHWTKWKHPHLISSSEPYDKTFAHKPWMLKHDGVVYHYYCAVGEEGRVIALATSKDLQGEAATE